MKSVVGCQLIDEEFNNLAPEKGHIAHYKLKTNVNAVYCEKGYEGQKGTV